MLLTGASVLIRFQLCKTHCRQSVSFRYAFKGEGSQERSQAHLEFTKQLGTSYDMKKDVFLKQMDTC